MKPSTEYLPELLDELQDYVILSLAINGTILDWNKTAEEITGYSADSIIGKNIQVFFTPENNNAGLAQQLLDTAIKKGRAQCHDWNVKKDGSRYWASTVLKSITENNSATGFILIIHNLAGQKLAEEKTKQQNTLLELAQDSIVIRDSNDFIIYWNKGAETLYGWTKEEATGKRVHSLLNTQFSVPLSEITNIVHSANQWQGELVHTKKNGDTLVVESRWALYENDQTGKVSLLEVNNDVTQRKKTEKALKESEALFAKAFHMSPVAMAIARKKDQIILDVNKSYLTMLGFERTELIGQKTTSVNILTQEDRDKFMSLMNEDGTVPDQEVNIRTKQGESLTAICSTLTIDIDGEDCTLSMAFDITARKKAEADLKRERYWQKVLIDNLPDLIFLKDKNSRFIIANKATALFMGVNSPDELIGRSDHDFYPKELADQYFAEEQNVINGGPPIFNLEKMQKDTANRTQWLSTFKTALRNDKNEITGIIGIERNITERRKAEEKQALLATIINSTEDAIISKTLEGIVTSWNHGAEILFGYTAEEIIGQHISILLPHERLSEEAQIINHIRNGEYIAHYETERLRKDGSKLTVSLSVSPLRDASGNIFGASKIIRDITERKRAEQQLLEAEQRYRITLDGMIEGCQIISFDWRYAYINPVAAHQGRSNPDTLIGRTMMECFPGIENTLMFSVLKHCMETRQTDQMENQFVYPDGTNGWFELHIQPSHEGIFILSLDITDRKKTEEELLNLTHQVSDLNASLERKVEQRTHQLQVANKELEAFSYSVSHDLRAPLRAINGYARMIEEDYGTTLDHDGKRLLTTIQKNAIQMGSLIDDLLAFSRLGRKDVQKTKINMAVMVKNVVDELMIEMKASTHVTMNISSYPVADSTLIRQVWINFIANAIKYSSKKEDPKIEIDEQIEDNRIIYSVKDNGIGFDMAYSHKLFGVFQRLHSAEEFEGTGVGLAIIKRIIDKHGGTVWAQSQRNQGATFFFALPSQQFLDKIDNDNYLD